MELSIPYYISVYFISSYPPKRRGEMKVREFIGLLLFSAMAANCTPASNITDPDKDDNHDDESSDESNSVVDINSSPIGSGNGTPVGQLCLIPELVENRPPLDSKCYLKTSIGPQETYEGFRCDAPAKPGHYWVKARSESYYNIWVMVPESDPKLVTQVLMPGSIITASYSPTLFYNSGSETFSHRDCGGSTVIQDSCPVPSATGTGGPSRCLSRDIGDSQGKVAVDATPE
ncbi:MAG: hypothetical protein ACI9TB_001782 [Parasphingorhabdus sp.]